jgi:hypothetical protein
MLDILDEFRNHHRNGLENLRTAASLLSWWAGIAFIRKSAVDAHIVRREGTELTLRARATQCTYPCSSEKDRSSRPCPRTRNICAQTQARRRPIQKKAMMRTTHARYTPEARRTIDNGSGPYVGARHLAESTSYIRLAMNIRDQVSLRDVSEYRAQSPP